ncbi:MAG: restriction endonuclease subunit S, partial [Thermodesulfobacteriota bacterium]|nr:restriction endonuclease subunit S [Thermodesulfobacteriota bacterium]
MSKSWPMVPLREVLTPVTRPEAVDPEKTYHILGAHWYAKGLYTKDIRSGSQIQAKNLYRVEQGDFVYNRLFAWKGSFAVASEENHGCYVSNEFPCFSVNKVWIDSRYLWRYFSRAGVWEEALGLSTGGTPTSRNRLKEDRLLAMKIPLPALEDQRRIVAKIDELASKIEEASSLRQHATKETDSIMDSAATSIFQNPEYKSFLLTIEDADLEINREYRNPTQLNSGQTFMYVDISTVPPGPSIINEGKIVPVNEAPSRARRVIKKDDIIISTVRPNLRAIAKIGEGLDNQICSTGFAVISCAQSIDPDFLLQQFCSPFFIDQCVAKTTGGHYPAINDTN